MRLAETNYDNAETGCCARLDVAKWDGREVQWTDKPFLKDHVRAILHIPLNTGAVMGRDQKAIEAAAAYPADPLWLFDEVSPWGADVYIAVDHAVPDTETVRLSGKYLTKVFEGPYRDVGKWLKAMDAYVAGRGYETKRHLFFYATCPSCARKFGKNQVVLFSQVA
ncbi:MAG TPA: hydrolase [Gemmatimonadaceae bacterium]|nr:hydrolase [Gemmatimonadaceae bacterium]